MSATSSPAIPVFARWFGSWQLRVERRPLAQEALAAAYDEAAPSWTRLTNRLGYGRAYQQIFQEFLATHAVEPKHGPLRVLDGGVGTGGFSLALAETWAQSIDLKAVDISEAMVSAATNRLHQHGIDADVRQASITSLPFPDDSFDVVIAAHVLEHLPNPLAALREMRRVLRPGGFIVTCLTRQSWLGAYIQTKWRTHRVNAGQAKQWLRTAGLRATTLKPPTRSLFRLTSLTAIGHNMGADLVGKELIT